MWRILLILILLNLSVSTIGDATIDYSDNKIPQVELIYDNVWGTIYNPVKEQCNDQPTITGDGSIINPDKASEHRWIAISQTMLWCGYRQSLTKKTDSRFRGKLKYGDYVWIDSPYEEINGWWEVRDTKNKRFTNSIDFLQTLGDGSLYNYNKLWSGRFNDIKIYRVVEK